MKTLTAAMIFVLAVCAAPSTGCHTQKNAIQNHVDLLKMLQPSHSDAKATIASALDQLDTPERNRLILDVILPFVTSAINSIIGSIEDPLVICGGGSLTLTLCNSISLDIVRVAPGIAVSGLSDTTAAAEIVDDAIEITLTIPTLVIDIGTSTVTVTIFIVTFDVVIGGTATISDTVITLTCGFPSLTDLTTLTVGADLALGALSFSLSLVAAGVDISAALVTFCVAVVSTVLDALSVPINDALGELFQGLLAALLPNLS